MAWFVAIPAFSGSGRFRCDAALGAALPSQSTRRVSPIRAMKASARYGSIRREAALSSVRQAVRDTSLFLVDAAVCQFGNTGGEMLEP